MPPKNTRLLSSTRTTATNTGASKTTTASSKASNPATKTAGSLKPAPKAAAGKAAAGKAAAGKAATGKSSAKAAVAQPTSLCVHDEPVISEEEKQAKVQEALNRALADTEEIRKASWQAQVDADRRREAARRKKAEEQAKRKKEEACLRKACLEASFDNDTDVLVKLLLEAEGKGIHNVVEFSDSHGNTLMSEAAAGGALEACQVLISKGANPNTCGEFQRSPLWRASFLGKADLITPLLEAGADPRIGNEQGELPYHVTSNSSIKEMLSAWDCSRTDQVVAQWEQRVEAQKAELAAAFKAAVLNAQETVDSAEEKHQKCQHALVHARQELEKRIYEHDMCVEEKKADDLTKATLDSIHSQEACVSTALAAAHQASEALDLARLGLRDQMQEQAQSGEAIPGTLVEIKALDDVLLRDVGGRIRSSGKWPLLMDPSGQASVFLRYMDSNYVNALSSHNMDPNKLRRSLLGGLRYGKPVVLDLMDVASLWSEMHAAFDEVQVGLLSRIMDKSLLKASVYESLIKQEDGEEYDSTKFQDSRISHFNFIIHTKSVQPPQDLLDATYPLRVNVKG